MNTDPPRYNPQIAALINQHEKLVAELDRLQAGAAVSECNRLRDLLQTCEAANKCLSMRVGVQATDLAQVVAERNLYLELSTIQQDLWSQYQLGPNPCGPLHRMQVIRAELAALLQEVTP